MTIRPIRPDDEPLIVRFHQGLSEQTVHQRYGGMMTFPQRVTHERLIRSCFTDYDRHIALVAVRHDLTADVYDILGVARLIRLHGRNEAEFSVVVADRVQGHGLGTKLLESLVRVARAERLARIIGQVAGQNIGMLRVCDKVGFTSKPETNEVGGDFRAEMILGQGPLGDNAPL